MVVLTEAGRVTIVVFLLAASTVGGVWLYTVYTGPLQDDPPRHFDAEGVFLVSYPLDLHEIQTPATPFDGMGRIRISDIHVPVQNVTTVEVIFQVSMAGPAFNDAYTITMTDPTGEAISGSHSVPQPSTGGYIRSETVIDWRREAHPSSETYHTTDRDKAARWSAENHTETSAKGAWSAEIQLNQPLFGRSGNASLELRLAYYEGVILPQTEISGPGPQPPGNDTNDTPAERSPLWPSAAPPLGQAGTLAAASFEGAPRTFITTRSVGETR